MNRCAFLPFRPTSPRLGWHIVALACALVAGCTEESLVEPEPVLIVEPITEADYFVRNDTSSEIALRATGLSGKPVELLRDTIPAGGEAHVYHAVEGSGGHVMPSNFFASFTASHSGVTLYSGVHNDDWEAGAGRFTLTLVDEVD